MTTLIKSALHVLIGSCYLLPWVATAAMNDEPLLTAVEVHQLEYRGDGGDSAVAWDVSAWFGTTRDRLVLRSEGEADDDETEELDTTVAWSRAVAPYWNVNLGWRTAIGLRVLATGNPVRNVKPLVFAIAKGDGTIFEFLE